MFSSLTRDQSVCRFFIVDSGVLHIQTIHVFNFKIHHGDVNNMYPPIIWVHFKVKFYEWKCLVTFPEYICLFVIMRLNENCSFSSRKMALSYGQNSYTVSCTRCVIYIPMMVTLSAAPWFDQVNNFRGYRLIPPPVLAIAIYVDFVPTFPVSLFYPLPSFCWR